MHAQLAVDVGAMEFHPLLADIEPVGNGFVGETFCDTLSHFTFSIREAVALESILFLGLVAAQEIHMPVDELTAGGR